MENSGHSGAGEAPAHVSGALAKVVDNIPHDFALATQTVFYAMAGVMALAFVVGLATMQPGKVESRSRRPATPAAYRRSATLCPRSTWITRCAAFAPDAGTLAA